MRLLCRLLPVLVAILLSATASAQSSPASGPPPGPPVVRQTLFHVLEGIGFVRPGQVLQVEVLGSPGASGSVEMAGSDKSVPLREVSPGRYVANLYVPPDLAVTRIPVQIHLCREDRCVSWSTRLPVNPVLGTP